MTRAQRVIHHAGFTLVELMVIVTIIGIVASVAAVNVVREMPRYRLTSATTQLAWTLQSLRMRAISQHHTVNVTFTTNQVYTVGTDRNDNGQIDSGEVQTTNFSATYPDVTLASSANPTFNPTGTVTNPPTITLTNASGAKMLTMNIIGNVTIQ